MKDLRREVRVLLLCVLTVLRPVRRPTAFAASRWSHPSVR